MKIDAKLTMSEEDVQERFVKRVCGHSFTSMMLDYVFSALENTILVVSELSQVYSFMKNIIFYYIMIFSSFFKHIS